MTYLYITSFNGRLSASLQADRFSPAEKSNWQGTIFGCVLPDDWPTDPGGALARWQRCLADGTPLPPDIRPPTVQQHPACQLRRSEPPVPVEQHGDYGVERLRELAADKRVSWIAAQRLLAAADAIEMMLDPTIGNTQ
jgi:hypothetical protein